MSHSPRRALTALGGTSSTRTGIVTSTPTVPLPVTGTMRIEIAVVAGAP